MKSIINEKQISHLRHLPITSNDSSNGSSLDIDRNIEDIPDGKYCLDGGQANGDLYELQAHLTMQGSFINGLPYLQKVKLLKETCSAPTKESTAVKKHRLINHSHGIVQCSHAGVPIGNKADIQEIGKLLTKLKKENGIDIDIKPVVEMLVRFGSYHELEFYLEMSKDMTEGQIANLRQLMHHWSNIMRDPVLSKMDLNQNERKTLIDGNQKLFIVNQFMGYTVKDLSKWKRSFLVWLLIILGCKKARNEAH